MTDSLFSLISSLNYSLSSDERIISLNEIEKIMNEDEQAIRLCYRKDMMNMEYNDKLRFFKQDSKEVKEARKNFYEAKKEFESYEIVKKYLKSYKEVRELLDEINEVLFSDFNVNLCPKK